MRYIDRRFLLPVVAATAWAQQPSPEAAAAEVALRARAEQFFQLQVDKKYRQAESMVADDTKDDYYNNSKFNIRSFRIEKVELLEGNTKAKVTMKAGVTLRVRQGPRMDLETPSTTLWKIENGQWVWYQDSTAGIQTPFGVITPAKGGGTAPSGGLPLNPQGVSSLRSAVQIDRNLVELTAGGPQQTVTISNGLPGRVDVALSGDQIPGVSVELEKKSLEGGEKMGIQLRATSVASGEGAIKITVSPIATELVIHVKVH